MTAPGRAPFFSLRVSRDVLLALVIALLAWAVAYADEAVPDVPMSYLYVVPVALAGAFFGLTGGIVAAVASILLFRLGAVRQQLPLFVEADVLRLVILVFVGVTVGLVEGHRRRSAELAEKLARLTRAQEELDSLVVHDLRTPLAGIVSALQLVEEAAELSPAHARLLQLALANAWNMEGLISDLLTVHAGEDGALALRTTAVRPAPAVAEALRQVTPLAQQKGVRLAARLPDGLPELQADPSLLQRVLVNLLGNALRFTPREGEVIVKVTREPGQRNLLFQVIDQGPGVPEEYRARVFDKFVRLDEQFSVHVSTGLGLTFVKMAVEAHHGRIWVEPNPAGGSIFSFVMPLG